MNRTPIGRNNALPDRSARQVKTTKARRPPGVSPIAFNRRSPDGCSLSRRTTTGRVNTASMSSIDIPCLSAAAAMKGDDAEAKWALGEAKSRAPNSTIKWFKARAPAPELVVRGLRKAGLADE